MKKEQEEEAAKRVAEERQKRTTVEQQVQQKPAANGNGHSAVKPQEIPKEPVRAPSPTPPPAPAPQQTIYENFADHYQSHPSTSVNEEKQAEPVKIIGGINVSSLLRSRKASSSSKNEDDDEDEWAADHHHAHEQPSVRPRSPSPAPAVHSQKSPGAHQHEGVRCVAHYSYQKSKCHVDLSSLLTVVVSSWGWWIGLRRKRNHYQCSKGRRLSFVRRWLETLFRCTMNGGSVRSDRDLVYFQRTMSKNYLNRACGKFLDDLCNLYDSIC